jgi:hypothetical protein
LHLLIHHGSWQQRRLWGRDQSWYAICKPDVRPRLTFEAALNWPHHRGTATAFPLAAFGLSAFFFTSVSGLLFPNSTSKYLLLLALGTFCLIFFPIFFVTVPTGEVYHALATSEEVERTRRDSSVMRRSSEWRPKVTDPAPSPELGN